MNLNDLRVVDNKQTKEFGTFVEYMWRMHKNI